MSEVQNIVKSPTQVAWENMQAEKAKLIEDTKQRLKEIRATIQRLESEECLIEDLLRKPNLNSRTGNKTCPHNTKRWNH